VTPLDIVGVCAAGSAAGAINAVVGSGSLITFPTLLGVGYSPVAANISNTIGLAPGAFSGAYGYREELKGQGRRIVVFGVTTVIGSVIGALLFLKLPGNVFEAVVPVLILFACVLVALQPRLVRRLARTHPRNRLGLGVGGVFLTSIYGGYFGAAQGVILIALLGIVIDENLHRINALKNVLAGTANGVAALLFIAISDVAWLPALLLAVSSVVGAQVGARYGRRIPPQVLRGLIIVVGVSVAALLFAEHY
jgi:uncharacterized membrane protein YfcA